LVRDLAVTAFDVIALSARKLTGRNSRVFVHEAAFIIAVAVRPDAVLNTSLGRSSWLSRVRQS
jgi:hypothetical protein